MPNKFLITTLAAIMTITTAVHATAESKKKKKVAEPEEQTEEEAQKEAMDDLVLDVAAGMLGGALKKGKLPKGGKVIIKSGVKAAKDAAKKDKDGGKEDSGKKDPLKMLFGG